MDAKWRRIPAVTWPRMALPVLFVALVALLLGDALASPERADAEQIRRAGLIISFDGGIAPNTLPRRGTRPISAQLSGRVRAADGGPLPQLDRLQIEIHRKAIFATRGLPVCRLEQISDALASVALQNCRSSLIGSGRFGVQLAFPDQLPTYTQGRVFAFNSRIGPRRAILLHIVTASPVVVAITVPLTMTAQRRGDFGLRMTTPSLPRLIGHHIYTTDFVFSLGRRFRAAGERRSYLNAGCPAPEGFSGGLFNLARATFEFSDGRRIRQTLTRNCRVVGG